MSVHSLCLAIPVFVPSFLDRLLLSRRTAPLCSELIYIALDVRGTVLLLIECSNGDAHEGAEGQSTVELCDDDAGEEALEERLVGLRCRLGRLGRGAAWCVKPGCEQQHAKRACQPFVVEEEMMNIA